VSIDKELDWTRAVDMHEKVIDWVEIEARIVMRGCGVCSICLVRIRRGECVVTSCEHYFHGR
jgi:hypothetical protein